MAHQSDNIIHFFNTPITTFEELTELTSRDRKLLRGCHSLIDAGGKAITEKLLPFITQYSPRDLFVLTHHSEALRDVCRRPELQARFQERFLFTRRPIRADSPHTAFDHIMGAYLLHHYEGNVRIAPEQPETQRLLAEALERGMIDSTQPSALTNIHVALAGG